MCAFRKQYQLPSQATETSGRACDLSSQADGVEKPETVAACRLHGLAALKFILAPKTFQYSKSMWRR